jgi:hypothetical protein
MENIKFEGSPPYALPIAQKCDGARRRHSRRDDDSKQPMARRWRSACRLERPACSSTSRSVCRMGCSCRSLREVKKAPASLYRGFK